MHWHLHIHLDDGPVLFAAITYEKYSEYDIDEFKTWLTLSEIDATISTVYPEHTLSIWFTTINEAQQFIEAWG